MKTNSLEEEYTKEVTTMAQKAGELLRSRYGLWFLGIISFADAALALPIITDPFMVAYIVANRSKALLGTIVTIVASVVGGIMTYVLASFFIDQILAFLGPTATVDFNTVVAVFDQGTFALAFLGALTPIPYTVVAIVAGALKGSLIMFILGSFVGRVIRFGIVAYFTYYFGDRAIELAKKHLVFSSIVAVLVVCAYILYKVLL